MDRLLATASTSSDIHNNTISLTDYKRHIYRRYQHGAHLEALDALLTDVSRYVESGGKEGVGRAIIEMPPRHGKTVSTSRLFPTWHIGRNPDHRVMLVSYGASLAEKNSRYARNLIQSPRYTQLYPHIHLARDSKAADAWDLEGYDGGMDAMGIGGSATGKGAQLLIIDDPVKNREEAESKLIRDKTWDSFNDDLYTRLEPGGAIVVMMTRWHQDDLIGRLLKSGEHWHRLRLPAIAEPLDALARTEGAALWPERFPLDTLRDIERTLGPYSWSALYQQNPVPSEGGIFKRAWFPIVHQHPEIVHAVRYWDLAMSEKTSADYTASVKIASCTDGHTYVVDVTHDRIDWGNLTDYMAGVMLNDGVNVLQGVEEKGYMSRAVQSLNADPRLHGYSVFGYPVDKDKLTRALPFAARCAAGMVHLLSAHWNEIYTDELCSFPNGAHDDQVDASSGAWTMLDSGMGLAVGELNYASDAGYSSSPY